MAWILTQASARLESALEGFLATAKASPFTFAGIAIPTIYIVASNMARLVGRAQTRLHHANDSLSLPLRSGTSTTLTALVKSVLSPCNLNPLIFNGHLQTAATLVKTRHIPIHYKRHIFDQEDPNYPGTFAVDFVTRPPTKDNPSTATDDLPPRTTFFTTPEWTTFSSGSTDTRPMLVVLHGLSGGSHELYLRAFLEPLVLHSHDWEACVLISRGCSHTTITTPLLYNARATWDIRQVVRFLRVKFPNRPLFGVGFSLGGNIMVNYLGEEGDRCELKAAVVFSSVWNMEVSAKALERSWFRKEVYLKTLGSNMKRLFERHVDQVGRVEGLDVEKVRSLKYLYEFDRHVQGPTWGYPSEGAYYRDASSIDAVMGVRIPLLAFHALDDPVVCDEVLPYEEVKVTPYVILCTTTMGGHLGWFETGGGRWFVKPSTTFLQKMADEVQFDQVSRTELGALKGHVPREERKPLRPYFDPVRRKLHFPEQ